MATTFKVAIRKTYVYHGATKTSYQVRWRTAGESHKESFDSSTLAVSFRSKLISAQGDGEAFDIESGLPLSMLRKKIEEGKEVVPWFQLACAYVDEKWGDSSPKSRSSRADVLTPITLAMLTEEAEASKPDGKVLRAALRWSFIATNRKVTPPTEYAEALTWIAKNTRPVTDLVDPNESLKVVSKFERKMDGSRGAPDTIRLRRVTFRSALDHAVMSKVIPANPLASLKLPKRTEMGASQVDRRSVLNPIQARTLLLAVAEQKNHGQDLSAFFGAMYFSGLRPEEAVNLREHLLHLPDSGWGQIYLEGASPEVGAEWTDSGTRSEERGLKHRPKSASRLVPCPPELVKMLQGHIDSYGGHKDGRLFRAHRTGGVVGSTTYGRVWDRARRAVLTDAVYSSPLGRRPYDLRHSCLSTWLRARPHEAVRIAEWAGNSVRVLLHTYARCLDGGQAEALSSIDAVLAGG